MLKGVSDIGGLGNQYALPSILVSFFPLITIPLVSFALQTHLVGAAATLKYDEFEGILYIYIYIY